jgi:hypothetical protein
MRFDGCTDRGVGRGLSERGNVDGYSFEPTS